MFFFPLTLCVSDARVCPARLVFFSLNFFVYTFTAPKCAITCNTNIYISIFQSKSTYFLVFTLVFFPSISLHYLILLVGYGCSLANTMPFIPQFIRLLVFIVLDAAPLVFLFHFASPRLAMANLYRFGCDHSLCDEQKQFINFCAFIHIHCF